MVKFWSSKKRKMSYHFHYLKPIASQTIEKVRKDLDRIGKRRSVKYQIEDLREMSYTLPTNYSFTIYRIFISAIDSGELKDVGWVVNDRNTFCLLCFKDFGMARWKHHCRACGALVCKECSNYENVLVSFEELGPQKVCQSCYKPTGGAVLRSSRRDGLSVIHPNSPKETATPNDAHDSKQIPEDLEEDAIEEPFFNQTIEIVPYPGFVVKTRREDDSKVFINIYHHESIKDEFLLLLRTVESSFYTRLADTMMIPTIYLGEKKATIDKNGAQSTLYTVVISSKYFEVENEPSNGGGAAVAAITAGHESLERENRSTSPALIQKIIEAINLNYQDNLQEQDYVRPRIKVGYQGLPIIRPEPFVLNRHAVSMIQRISDEETRSVITGGRRSVIERESEALVPVKSDHRLATSTSAGSKRNESGGTTPTAAAGVTRPTVLSALPRSDNSLQAAAENASVISDMTQSVNTDASSTVGSSRLNLASYFYGAGGSTANEDGRSLLTSEMLRNAKELSITSKESMQLIEEWTRKPTVLIGWQIMLLGDTDNLNGVFVVTATRKNHLRKTEYRVSNLIQEDQWVKLKRNDQKTGIEFRPLRKVLSTL